VTTLLWLGTRQQLSVTVSELTTVGCQSQLLKLCLDLGVIINSQLSMSDHVSSLSGMLFPAASTPVGQIITNH